MKFEFPTDEEGQLFCEEIVGKMCENYGIDEIEAVTRVSDFWRGQTLFEDDIAFHNFPEQWAGHIYFGADSFWWTNPEGLTAKPMPKRAST